jgi:hypothetical protein
MIDCSCAHYRFAPLFLVVFSFLFFLSPSFSTFCPYLSKTLSLFFVYCLICLSISLHIFSLLYFYISPSRSLDLFLFSKCFLSVFVFSISLSTFVFCLSPCVKERVRFNSYEKKERTRMECKLDYTEQKMSR